MSRLPTFLVLSPRGAGGDLLATALGQTPGCFVATREIGFFSVEWDRGAPWYASFFTDAGVGDVAVGEHSTSYVRASVAAEVAARVDGFLEGVQLVAVVRHPAVRARAAYDALRNEGRLEETATFEQLLHDEGDGHALRAGSRYSQWLRPFRERFGERLLIVAAERIAGSPDTREDIATHVGLPRQLAEHLYGGAPTEVPIATTDVFDDEVDTLADEFGVDVKSVGA